MVRCDNKNIRTLIISMKGFWAVRFKKRNCQLETSELESLNLLEFWISWALKNLLVPPNITIIYYAISLVNENVSFSMRCFSYFFALLCICYLSHKLIIFVTNVPAMCYSVFDWLGNSAKRKGETAVLHFRCGDPCSKQSFISSLLVYNG